MAMPHDQASGRDVGLDGMNWVEVLRSDLNGAFRHLEAGIRRDLPALARVTSKRKSDEEMREFAEPFVQAIAGAITAATVKHREEAGS